MKPDAAENNGVISLMCVATTARSRRTQLYLQNLYRHPLFTQYIRIIALQVDTLIEREVGKSNVDAAEAREAQLRDLVIHGKAYDHAMLSELLKRERLTLREDVNRL